MATATRRRIEAQMALIDALSQALTPTRVGAEVCAHAGPLVGASGCAIALRPSATAGLALLESAGFEPEGLAELVQAAPWADALDAGGLRVLDAPPRAGDGWPRLVDGSRPRRLALVPLVARRRAIGVLGLAYDAAASFDDDAAAFVELVAKHAAHALERAQIHEAQEAWTDRVEEESARFRSLVDELDAVFWEADPETFLFSFVSKRAERVLGYPTDKWLRPGFWASIIHPEDRTWAVDFCVACTREGQDHVFEYRLLAADGRIVHVRDVVYVLRDETGRPTKLRGVMLDITREREGQPLEPRIGRTLDPERARPHVAP